jgi:hypothetical protein
MTIYSAVLFIHVVSAIGLFIALAAEGAIVFRIRSARSVEQARFLIRVFQSLRIVAIPSFLGILVGGLYLASKWGKGTFWIPFALGATLLIMVIGGILTCLWRIVISPIIHQDFPSCYDSTMRNLVVLFIHFIGTLARLLGPGGVRSLIAESLLLKHQLLIVNRCRQRSPNLSAWDRVLAGWMALLVRPTRLLRSAIVLKPSTLLALHKAMSKRKYRMLFSTNRRRKPGPKGPSVELVHAVVEMKQRNPNWGCPRIAQQIALAFHIPIDKDLVRRILAHHYLRDRTPMAPPG